MSKFNLVKKISLAAVLGEGHEQSYLSFKPMTFKDAKDLEGLQPTEDFTPVIPKGATAEQIKKLQAEAKAKENAAGLEAVDKAVAFVKSKFVKGQIMDIDAEKLVDVDAEDFDNGNLSVDIINHCMKELAGGQPEGFTRA